MATIDTTTFGHMPDGQPVDMITLQAGEQTVKLINYGAIIVQWHTPDKQGQQADIVLGFDNLHQYLTDSPSFGCCCGRVANRIANGRFTLNGKTYQLDLNHGKHHLHGGAGGFGRRVWSYSTEETEDGPSVIFTLESTDGDQGYPGYVETTVTYTLTESGTLRLTYHATTDQPTLINLTNHSYFNLGGHESGDVLSQLLQIHAKQWTCLDEEQIPTGEITSLKNSPWDFGAPMLIGSRMDEVNKLTPRGGYDLNYILDNPKGELVHAASVWDEKTGRILACYTTEPGVQLYTMNIERTYDGKDGAVYGRHAGVCLETQHFPDAVNHANFPSIILHPGEVYSHVCEYRVGVSDQLI